MTIPELHAQEELRRREFPVVEKSTFLAHAAVCPLPRRVAQAIADSAQAASLGDQDATQAPGLVADVRARAARLIGAQPSEIALVGPTSLGLSFVAAGLPFRKGDNVLVYFDDYPSNVYPWLALSERGVEVRFLNVRELGKVRLVDVQGQVDEHTRLVALSSGHYLTGWRLNIEAIGKFLNSRNILFCLDAIQTLGAFPVSVKHVDFLAADAHKWLLGPCAAGILFVKQDLQAKLQPVVHGWKNVKSPGHLTQDELVYRTDARRYEAGSLNLLGLAGLRAALELVEEIGVPAIAEELLRQRARVVPALQAKGYTVLQPDLHADNAGATISFHREGTDLAALHQQLQAAGVITSLRSLPGGQAVLRISPHYYNTDAEVDRALELLPGAGPAASP
jgi:cysteine desulfurase/selenocysteine lyase